LTCSVLQISERFHFGATEAAQWQFPAKSGSGAPAFMSFRTARGEEGSEEFSISGFRPAGDALDGIKKQTSLPAVISQHQQQQVRHSAELAVPVVLLLRLRCWLDTEASVVSTVRLVSAEAVRAQQQPGHGTAVSCRGARRPALAGDGLQRGGASSSPWWIQASAAAVGAPPCAVQSGQPDGQVAELPQWHRCPLEESAAFHHEQRVWWLYSWRVWRKVLISFSPHAFCTRNYWDMYEF